MLETGKTTSDWLYEINKVPVNSLHVRYIPVYNRYVSSSTTDDQIDVNVTIVIVIIAGVSASDNAVPVWWSYWCVLLSFNSNLCCCYIQFDILVCRVVLICSRQYSPFFRPLPFLYFQFIQFFESDYSLTVYYLYLTCFMHHEFNFLLLFSCFCFIPLVYCTTL